MSNDQDTQALNNYDDEDTDCNSVFQQEENKRALATIRANIGSEVTPDFDGLHCLDCGNEIVKHRLLLDRVRCLDCQKALELSRRTATSNDQDTQALNNYDDEDADCNSVFQQEENKRALATIRANIGSEVTPDFDGLHCLDCGNEIVKPRLRLDRVRCLDCQKALELSRRTE